MEVEKKVVPFKEIGSILEGSLGSWVERTGVWGDVVTVPFEMVVPNVDMTLWLE